MNAHPHKLTVTTREVTCDECGGSGMRAGHSTSPYDFAEVECFDCGGEGSWTEDEQLTECQPDPLLRRSAAR